MLDRSFVTEYTIFLVFLLILTVHSKIVRRFCVYLTNRTSCGQTGRIRRSNYWNVNSLFVHYYTMYPVRMFTYAGRLGAT